MPLARVLLRHTDMGELRRRVGDPGHGAVIHLGGDAQERVADDDAGMIAGDMGELILAGGIADADASY